MYLKIIGFIWLLRCINNYQKIVLVRPYSKYLEANFLGHRAGGAAVKLRDYKIIKKNFKTNK